MAGVVVEAGGRTCDYLWFMAAKKAVAGPYVVQETVFYTQALGHRRNFDRLLQNHLNEGYKKNWKLVSILTTTLPPDDESYTIVWDKRGPA